MRSFFSVRQFVADAERAEATVLEVNRFRDNDGDSFYVTTLEFVDLEGQSVTIASGGSETVGERFEVLYEPDNSEDAVLHRDAFDTTGWWGFVGALYTGMHFAGVIKRWRGRRKEEKRVAARRKELNYVVEPAHDKTDENGKVADGSGPAPQRNYIVDPITDESE